MPKYVVVTTFRTGSTLLCDVISKEKNVTNHGEFFYNKINDHLIAQSNLPVLTKEYQSRIAYLRASNNWVTKIITTPLFSGREIIDSSCTPIFLYRKNIVEQFKSEINMAYRYMLLGAPRSTFTKDTPPIEYDIIDVPPKNINNGVLAFVRKLEVWYLLYNIYKDRAITLSYEDNIKNFDLTKLGITNNSSDQIQTPYNCTNLKDNDWQYYVDFLSNYKYYTDIEPG